MHGIDSTHRFVETCIDIQPMHDIDSTHRFVETCIDIQPMHGIDSTHRFVETCYMEVNPCMALMGLSIEQLSL